MHSSQHSFYRIVAKSANLSSKAGQETEEVFVVGKEASMRSKEGTPSSDDGRRSSLSTTLPTSIQDSGIALRERESDSESRDSAIGSEATKPDGSDAKKAPKKKKIIAKKKPVVKPDDLPVPPTVTEEEKKEEPVSNGSATEAVEAVSIALPKEKQTDKCELFLKATSITLNALAKPEINLDSSAITKRTGDSLDISADLVSIAQPETTWTKDGVALVADENLTIVTRSNSTSVHVAKVDLSHAGRYELSATNAIGTSKAYVDVKVEGAL